MLEVNTSRTEKELIELARAADVRVYPSGHNWANDPTNSFRSFAHGIQLAFARTRDLAGCSNARLVSFGQKTPK
ncbi:hypothetical protein [Brevibacillus porteri]|uniref:hypothetical protein n=1 Tax=Brevibacillus porteri TaxID=2126350 RepID=UPI003D23A9F5